MSGYLLDTNVLLLAMSDSGRLSVSIRDALKSGPNTISVLSYWEVALKVGKGKLEVGDTRIWWSRALRELGARVLTLRPEHVAELATMATIHSDPFDRMLMGQAVSEGLALVTTDRQITLYASDRLRVIA